MAGVPRVGQHKITDVPAPPSLPPPSSSSLLPALLPSSLLSHPSPVSLSVKPRIHFWCQPLNLFSQTYPISYQIMSFHLIRPPLPGKKLEGQIATWYVFVCVYPTYDEKLRSFIISPHPSSCFYQIPLLCITSLIFFLLYHPNHCNPLKYYLFLVVHVAYCCVDSSVQDRNYIARQLNKQLKSKYVTSLPIKILWPL